MKILTCITAFLLLLSSCSSENSNTNFVSAPLKKAEKKQYKPIEVKARNKVITLKNTALTSLLSPQKITAQKFKVNASETVTITSKSGVKITLNEYSFVDSKGNIVEGDVDIEYKEALKPEDIVLGNLTTLSNGKFLESGGMMYLNATANGKQLSLAPDKSIRFNVPTKNYKAGMMIFEGNEKDGKIDWVNPVNIQNPMVWWLKAKDIDSFWMYNQNYYKANYKDTVAFAYRVKNKYILMKGEYHKEIHKVFIDSLSKIALANKNIADTLLKIGDIMVQAKTFPSYNQLLNAVEAAKPNKIRAEKCAEKSSPVAYIFSIKKLGWANIDRFNNDRRNQPVEFVTKINKPASFDVISISILFPKQNMYIPGYQKKDGTFSFTHGDYEAPKFPVGETAIVLATGYKKGNPHYALQKLTIKKQQTISLSLKETTEEQMKADLKAKI